MRPPTLTIDPALADQRAALVGTARALLERFSSRTAAKGWSRRSCVGPLTVTADGCLEATGAAVARVDSSPPPALVAEARAAEARASLRPPVKLRRG